MVRTACKLRDGWYTPWRPLPVDEETLLAAADGSVVDRLALAVRVGERRLLHAARELIRERLLYGGGAGAGAGAGAGGGGQLPPHTTHEPE